jgi:acyl-coenzyme A synthetase/AMP-(fatty) acid ligase
VLTSDGKALPGVDLEIKAEDGKVVPAGEEGEICHGGPGLMLGYWRDPERTAEAIEPSGLSHRVTWARWTTTATCGSPGGSRT